MGKFFKVNNSGRQEAIRSEIKGALGVDFYNENRVELEQVIMVADSPLTAVDHAKGIQAGVIFDIDSIGTVAREEFTHSGSTPKNTFESNLGDAMRAVHGTKIK